MGWGLILPKQDIHLNRLRKEDLESELEDVQNAVDMLKDKHLSQYLQIKDSHKQGTFVEDRAEFLEEWEDLLELIERLQKVQLFIDKKDEIVGD